VASEKELWMYDGPTVIASVANELCDGFIGPSFDNISVTVTGTFRTYIVIAPVEGLDLTKSKRIEVIGVVNWSARSTASFSTVSGKVVTKYALPTSLQIEGISADKVDSDGISSLKQIMDGSGYGQESKLVS
jgi:hypothetical protein